MQPLNKDSSGIRLRAAACTIGLHLLVLLFFFLYSFSAPVQASPEELGMEVNLGSADDGSGTDQGSSPDAPSQLQSAEEASSGAEDNSLQQLQESDNDEDPAVNTATSPRKPEQSKPAEQLRIDKPDNKTVRNENKVVRQKPRYTYQAGSGKGGNLGAEDIPGGSEGNTTGSGDRGVAGGTPGSANYQGSPGAGNGGISHTLTGRSISPSRFEATFHESGRVTVRVTVDQEGNIIDRQIQSSPSRELSALALQKLSQAKFTRKTDGAPYQFGVITILFKAKAA